MPRATRPTMGERLKRTEAERDAVMDALRVAEQQHRDTLHLVQGQRNLIEQQASLIDANRSVPLATLESFGPINGEAEKARMAEPIRNYERGLVESPRPTDGREDGIVHAAEQVTKAVCSLDATIDRLWTKLDPILSPMPDVAEADYPSTPRSSQPSPHRHALYSQTAAILGLERRLLTLLELLDV